MYPCFNISLLNYNSLLSIGISVVELGSKSISFCFKSFKTILKLFGSSGRVRNN